MPTQTGGPQARALGTAGCRDRRRRIERFHRHPPHASALIAWTASSTDGSTPPSAPFSIAIKRWSVEMSMRSREHLSPPPAACQTDQPGLAKDDDRLIPQVQALQRAINRPRTTGDRCPASKEARRAKGRACARAPSCIAWAPCPPDLCTTEPSRHICDQPDLHSAGISTVVMMIHDPLANLPGVRHSRANCDYDTARFMSGY